MMENSCSYGTNESNAISPHFNGNRRGICPEGWHIPSKTEWNSMFTVVGVSNKHGAGKLAGGNDWKNYTPQPLPIGAPDDATADEGDEPGNIDYAERNISGFSAVPTGVFMGVTSTYFRESASFWSSTASISYVPNNAYGCSLSFNQAGISDADYYSRRGYSVRCVRD